MPNYQKHKAPSNILDDHRAKQLLRRYNIPVVPERMAHDTNTAIEAAAQVGFPVVVKGVAAGVAHKTEKNWVHVNLPDDAAVARACRQICRDGGKQNPSFLIQAHVGGHREFMAGFYRDPLFGPVILFGVGGVLTEAVEDVVLRLAPLTAHDARQMLAAIKARKLLDAFRGESPVKTEALAGLLVNLSRLALEQADIAEMDINPIKITPAGDTVAVDAMASLQPAVSSGPGREPVSPDIVASLFHPRSIAFVGASAHLGKWGHLLIVNTVSGGFNGDIHLVNAKGGTIAGRTVYKRLSDVPGQVDLAVVTIPAAAIAGLIEQCRDKGIRRMVLITSGFGETGADGKALQAEVVDKARQAGLCILGPNTMGIANPHINLFCTGATIAPLPGATAMVSQSGNMGTQLLAFAEKQGIGIRCFAGSGNEAMITTEDYLECFEQDSLTRTILLYVESVKNGRRFFDSARRISVQKPIVLLKGGQTRAGERAAAGHTGAMSSDNRIFDAMCRQAGILKVEQPMELLDLAAAFSSLPLPRGPRTAIMTWGGGWGVVTADLCQARGLDVPPLDDRLVCAIDELLPSFWSRTNPVDMVGEQNPDVAVKTLEMLAAWDGCDAVINLGILGRRLFMERFATAALAVDPDVCEKDIAAVGHALEQFEQAFIEHSARLMERHGKPIVGVSLLSDARHQTVYRIDGVRYRAVYYETPERAVNALAELVGYRQWRDAAG